MKKVILAVFVLSLGFVMTGCLGPKVDNGGFTTVPAGLLFSEMSGGQFIQDKILPETNNFTVIKRISAEATTTSYFGLISTGDSSIATLKSKALYDCKEADEIIDIEVDFFHSNILGIVNKVTVVFRGVAIKYNSLKL